MLGLLCTGKRQTEASACKFWSDTVLHCPCHNNNNNNRISIASFGRNFRGAGGQVGSVFGKTEVLSLDLKTDRESLMRTVCGSKFQTDGAENRKARLQKSVLMNCWSSSRMAVENQRSIGCFIVRVTQPPD